MQLGSRVRLAFQVRIAGGESFMWMMSEVLYVLFVLWSS